MIKILMIEDDLELAEILSEYLNQFDMEVKTVDDPYFGLSALNNENFDLIILDLTLPEIDGLEVCKEIRKCCNIPIIISSARHDITDKVNALENGADDYLPKPYNPQELCARIKRHILRQNEKLSNSDYAKKDLILNEYKRVITLCGEELNLTQAEFDVLSYLIKKDGGVITREELVYNCNSINEESTNKSINVLIGRIRTKLGENPKDPKYIHAVRGIGYKLVQ